MAGSVLRSGLSGKATGRVRFGVDVQGLVEAQRTTLGIAERVADARPAFRVLDKHASTVFIRQFASEGAWGGRSWPRLRPATIRARQKPGRGRGGILRDTNRLWASLVKVGPESIRLIEPQRYERGTIVPYAFRHQIGDRVPVRQIIPDPMPEEVLNTWERILADHFAGVTEAPDVS